MEESNALYNVPRTVFNGWGNRLPSALADIALCVPSDKLKDKDQAPLDEEQSKKKKSRENRMLHFV